MAASDSFDPRTWPGDDPSPVTVASALRQPPPKAPPPGRSPRGWLGLALSAAILLGGALAAYSTRIAEPGPGAASSAR